jgi:hypothetical protein
MALSMKKSSCFLSVALIIPFFFMCGGNSNPADTTGANTVVSIKLQPGSWWVQAVNDTSITVTDSAGHSSRDVVIRLHHIYQKLVQIDAGTNGELAYVFAVSDTQYNPQNQAPDTVTNSSKVLNEKDSMLTYFLPLNYGGMNDSVKVTMLDFPLSVGKSWTNATWTLDTSIDTSITYSGFNLALKIRAVGAFDGTTNVPSKIDYTFGATPRNCLTISASTNGKGAILIDTNVAIGVIKLFSKGDTATNLVTQTTTEEYFSTDYTIPLWTREVSTSFDTVRVIALSSTRDTVRSVATIIKLFDQRTGTTITQ